MWAMNERDKRELDAYRALGTVSDLGRLLESPYPPDNEYAPLPLDDWDDRETCGLLDENV